MCLAEKIDKLEASSQSPHDAILTKLTTLETKTSELSEGIEGMNQEMEAVKQTLQKKADIVQVELLDKKLEEMENQSKRNNIIIWNIPEGAEKDSSCLALVTSVLTEHMGFEEIEVRRAHRTNIKNEGKVLQVVLLYLGQSMYIYKDIPPRNTSCVMLPLN